MRAHTPGAGGRLGWLLRRHAWLVLVCMLAGAGTPLLLGESTLTYQADSIVVARQLALKEQILPTLGESVFTNGRVAETVAEHPDVAVDAEGLIPGKISLVVPQDSIVMIVQARDPDPEDAATLATAAANALAAELNLAGAGVGQFAVQADAVVPTEPLRRTSPLLLAITGALAGLLVGVGLAALLGVLRRPVVTPGDVERAVGVPFLGRVDVPLRRDTYPGPVGIRGVATVTRWMATVPPGRLLLISPKSAVALRQRVYVMVAVALSTVRPVRFRAADHVVMAVRKHRAELPPTPDRGIAADDELVLVDGGSPLEILDPASTSVSVVAIAPRGITMRRLRLLANDYQGAGLVGVVLTEARPGLRRHPARATASPAPVATETRPVRGTTIPEPGPA